MCGASNGTVAVVIIEVSGESGGPPNVITDMLTDPLTFR